MKPIETSRLILRDFLPEDVQDLFQILGDGETMRLCEHAYDLDKTRAFLETFCIARRGAVAAVEKGQQKVIGYLLFQELEPGTYEMGWFFNRSFWGRGYAYEGCKALADYAFRECHARKLIAETIDSEKSVGLMKKLGMTLEEIQKTQAPDNTGTWVDLYQYALEKEEWEKKGARKVSWYGEVTMQELTSYESGSAFVESFFGDPDFSDPMLCTQEQLEGNLLKAFQSPEKHRVLGFYRENQLIGLFSFLVLREENYLEMLVGLSREWDAYRELFSWLNRHYSGCQVDFVFNPRNHLLRELLMEKGAEWEPEQQKMVLGTPILNTDCTGVELFSQEYAQQYFAIHNKDMYWTGEKVAAAPDRFRTFLAVQKDRVVGYLDVTHCFEENEPFDLMVLPEYRGQGYGRKLLTSALAMNQPKGMMLLVETDNHAALRLYESLGFQKAEGPNYLTAHWTVPAG